ncbi:hypothetical protein [Flavobacterium sp.]|uniref:hypothetical protein n=1 Tax=Flavobacterium sp. TaxID=239 RepID=UPI0026154FC9|nr:hypothetical protein [Flavobacterium sp.]
MKKVALVIPFFLFFSCKSDKDKFVIPKNEIKISKVNQDIDTSKIIAIQKTEENNETYLKGGFSIIYSTDNEEQYLIFKKDEKVIDTLNSCSFGCLEKNLGYVISDFDDTFILGQSFGGGNPTVIQLYEKKTGKNLIKQYSAIIDVDTTKQVVLYSENDVPKQTDRMTLFDAKTRQKKTYEFPKEVFGEPEILNRIHLTNTTDKSFTIEYEFDEYNQKKQKMYSR